MSAYSVNVYLVLPCYTSFEHIFNEKAMPETLYFWWTTGRYSYDERGKAEIQFRESVSFLRKRRIRADQGIVLLLDHQFHGSHAKIYCEMVSRKSKKFVRKAGLPVGAHGLEIPSEKDFHELIRQYKRKRFKDALDKLLPFFRQHNSFTYYKISSPAELERIVALFRDAFSRARDNLLFNDLFCSVLLSVGNDLEAQAAAILHQYLSGTWLEWQKLDQSVGARFSYHLALAYERDHEFRKALETLDEIKEERANYGLRFEPSDVVEAQTRIYRKTTRMYLEKGEFARAAEVMRRGIRREELHKPALLTLQYLTGEQKQAQRGFHNLLKKQKIRSIDLMVNMAKCISYLGGDPFTSVFLNNEFRDAFSNEVFVRYNYGLLMECWALAKDDRVRSSLRQLVCREYKSRIEKLPPQPQASDHYYTVFLKNLCEQVEWLEQIPAVDEWSWFPG